MAIVAGTARGSTTPAAHANLSQIARAMQGIQHAEPDPSSAAVPAPGGTTDGGIDVQGLLAAMKSGQISAGSLMKILAMLMGVGPNATGVNPRGGENVPEGAPPGGPIGMSFAAGVGAGGQ